MVYNEVLEVLKYASNEEYEKIPKEEIEYYEQNKDKSYDYTFDSENTEISNNACVMLVKLYLKYIASEDEKAEIIQDLKKNSELIEEEKNKSFNPDELFKRKKDEVEDLQNDNTQLVQYVELKWYKKIWNKIKNIFSKNREDLK
jgi:hypothetical protein